MRNRWIRWLGCVGVGTLLGYALARMDSGVSASQGASTTTASRVAKDRGKPPEVGDVPACCSGGLDKHRLLTMPGPDR